MWILQSASDTDSDADGGSLTFRLSPGAIKTIGRAPRADFVVDAALVSRVHCRLTASDDGVDVVDLDSTNGTYINDERVKTGCIKNGDRLRVGRVELKIERG
jgi:pSer/pThr/pTyr-binding forkhead associated (FHA) protein